MVDYRKIATVQIRYYDDVLKLDKVLKEAGFCLATSDRDVEKAKKWEILEVVEDSSDGNV